MRFYCFAFYLQAEITSSVERYHRGLVVIVYPWRPEGGTTEDDDGVRLTMDKEECSQFAQCLMDELKEYHIGYMVQRERPEKEQ